MRTFKIAVIAALVMGLMGREIISIAIQRGMFRPEDTEVTAFVLTGYCYGLFSVGAFNFLQRYFYSSGQYAFPFYVATFVTVVDISLSLILKETWLRVAGLSIANSVAFTLGLIILYRKAHVQIGGIPSKNLLSTFFKVVLASVPAFMLILFFHRVFPEYWRGGSSLAGLGYLAAELLLLMLLYLGMYRLLKVEMIGHLVNRLRRKADEEK